MSAPLVVLLIIATGLALILATLIILVQLVRTFTRHDEQTPDVDESPWWIAREHVHDIRDLVIAHAVTDLADRREWGKG